MPDKKTEVRSFEDTIIDALKRCQSIEEALHLLKLIEETKISQNHDQIIKAIDDLFDSTSSLKYAPHCSEPINKVKASILAQKKPTVTDEEKFKKKFLRMAIRTYGSKIGRQLASDTEAAGNDLTMQRAAIVMAERALQQPLKDGVNQRINTPYTPRAKNKKP